MTQSAPETRHFELSEFADGTLRQTNGEGFDGWLAKHDSTLAQQVLRHAASDWHAENSGTSPRLYKWLEDRADGLGQTASVGSVGFEVGQEVILRDLLRGSDKSVTISRVGSKYVYVEVSWREWAFRIDTGLQKSEFEAGYRIGTKEMFAEWDRARVAQDRLRAATRSFGWANNLGADDANLIADIIERSKS